MSQPPSLTRPDPTGPDGPLLPAGAAPLPALQQVQADLAPLAEELGLLRLTTEERAALGRTSGLFQVRKSLSCLRLLHKRPELAARLQRESPAAWRGLVDLRLAIAQARGALDGVIKAASRGELLLLSQITEANDRIEDHLVGWMNRKEATGPERLRLRAKFDDPANIRQSYGEFLIARKARRERRRALHAAAVAQARAEGKRARAAERLTSRTPEDRP